MIIAVPTKNTPVSANRSIATKRREIRDLLPDRYWQAAALKRLRAHVFPSRKNRGFQKRPEFERMDLCLMLILIHPSISFELTDQICSLSKISVYSHQS